MEVTPLDRRKGKKENKKGRKLHAKASGLNTPRDPPPCTAACPPCPSPWKKGKGKKRGGGGSVHIGAPEVPFLMIP